VAGDGVAAHLLNQPAEQALVVSDDGIPPERLRDVRSVAAVQPLDHHSECGGVGSGIARERVAVQPKQELLREPGRMRAAPENCQEFDTRRHTWVGE